MSNFVSLAVTKIDGNTVSETRLFDPAKMLGIKASGTAVEFSYPNPDVDGSYSKYVTGALTQTQLQNSINQTAASGSFDVCLIFDPSANADEKTIAAHDLKDANGNVFYLPANAYIWDGFYRVVTTFTSATDAATIALSVPSDDVAGIKAAIAISNGANPWDTTTTPAAIIQVGTVASMSEKTTAARTIQAVVAVEALTAGKLILFLKVCVTAA
jgi:hypothetical protein